MKMNKRVLFGFVLCVLLFAVYVVADLTLKTQSGGIVLSPVGGVVNLNGSNLSGVNYLNAGQSLHIGIPSDIVYLTGLVVNDKTLNGKDGSGLAFYAETWSAYATGQPMDFYVRNTNGTGSWKRIIRINGGNFSTEKSVQLTNENLELGGGSVKNVGGSALTFYADNTTDVGSSGARVKDVYYGGSLKTSSVGYVVPAGKSALEIVSGIRTLPDGQIDHSSVDESLLSREIDYSQEYYRDLREIQKISSMESNKSFEEIAIERNFTAYLSKETQEYELLDVSRLIIAQKEAMAELKERVEKLEQKCGK